MTRYEMIDKLDTVEEILLNITIQPEDVIKATQAIDIINDISSKLFMMSLKFDTTAD